MKKTILLFAMGTSLLYVNAQTATAVDPHAGHNHAKETKEVNKISTQKASNKAAVEITPSMPKPVMVPVVPVTSTTAEVAVLPETLVSKELEFDFGKIPQGKPVTHVFTVTNTSKAPYKLDNVQASCGCTTPEWEREKMIAPGESVEIKVGFNAGAVAPFIKPVTITYNSTQTKVLNIKGEVYATPATSAPVNAEAAEIKK